MPSQKLIDLINGVQGRIIGQAEEMRQGDTIAVKRLQALQNAEAAIESLTASAQKTILLALIDYFVQLEEEVEFWSD